MTVKEEEAVVQAFIKMWKDVTKTSDKLNASQLDQLQKMMKSTTTMISNTKTVKANITMSNKKIKFDEKELVVREKLKKADEHLIKLRHKLNIEQEREHGAQVRRNINLRHNMDSFNDKFEMLKKSIGGGFGFQAAIGTTIKKMGSLTRSYQEFEDASGKYDDALSVATASARSMAFANTKEDKDKAKEEHEIQLKALERAYQTKEGAKESAEPTQGKFKPLFEKLGKMGEFLGKKAVPIGLGVGVAGVLMSVIVKSFSASPLFAAMMKLIKFSVQLILMPIGTFFGALLRPILITLLRKFIIPFYSTWMPKLMRIGDQLGGDVAKTVTEAATIAEEILSPTIIDKETGERREKTPLEKAGSVLEGYAQVANAGFGGAWWVIANALELYAQGVNSLLGGTPEAEAQVQETIEGKMDDAGFDMSGEDPMFNGKTPSDIETPAEKHVRLDKEAADRKELMLSDQERTDRELAAAAEEKAKKEAEMHKEQARIMERDRAMNAMNETMDKYRTTGGIIEDVMPKFGEREQLWNEQTGRGGDIKNAGANFWKKEYQNATAGYTMGGSAKSQSILEAYNAFKNGVTAANGFDGMVNSPTMFLAGEAGSEHVTVTPNGQGGGSSIVVNIGTMNGSDNDLRKLKQTILEVIQESSANRGRL